MKRQNETDDEKKKSVIPDGSVVRVAMTMMDSTQRSIAADKLVGDGSAHRPGFHRSTDDHNAIMDSAYAQYETRLRDEYKNPDPPPYGSKEGQPCKANPDPKLNYTSYPKRNEEMPPTSERASLICEGVRLLSVPTSAGDWLLRCESRRER